jgi:hypothetical protein
VIQISQTAGVDPTLFAVTFTRTRYKWLGSQFQEDGPDEVFPNPTDNAIRFHHKPGALPHSSVVMYQFEYLVITPKAYSSKFKLRHHPSSKP